MRMWNYTRMKLELNRIDVCDILLALTALTEADGAPKWAALHDKIAAQLVEHDCELAEEDRVREGLEAIKWDKPFYEIWEDINRVMDGTDAWDSFTDDRYFIMDGSVAWEYADDSDTLTVEDIKDGTLYVYGLGNGLELADRSHVKDYYNYCMDNYADRG